MVVEVCAVSEEGEEGEGGGCGDMQGVFSTEEGRRVDADLDVVLLVLWWYVCFR